MILKNGKRLDGMGDSMPIGSIVEYNGADIPDGWEVLPDEGESIYSQEERRVGTWINGEPLYQKVVDFGSLPNTNYKDVSLGVDENVIVTQLTGVAYSASGNALALPYAAGVGYEISLSYQYETKHIRIQTYGDRSACTAMIVVQYIKD